MALKGRSFRMSALALGILTAGVLVFGACSDQGEGERCDTLGDNGGNDECMSGLECTVNFNGPGQQAGAVPSEAGAPAAHEGRCCPPFAQRTSATTLTCKLSTNPGGGDAAPPPESGAAADVSVDAPQDAPSKDAQQDAADAGADALADADAAGG